MTARLGHAWDKILLDYGKAWTGYHVAKGADMIMLSNYSINSKLAALIAEERGHGKRKRKPNPAIFNKDNVYPAAGE